MSGRCHRRQLVVLDSHELARVFGQITTLRDYEHDRIADEPHPVPGERLMHRGSVALDLEVEIKRLRQTHQILCRVDSDDSRERACVGVSTDRIRAWASGLLTKAA